MPPSPTLLADAPETVPIPPLGIGPFVRLRVRFQKSDLIRWLSHHDLIRAMDRLLRRLALPVVHSQGFRPNPAMVFALSLPLGALGSEEIVEIDLHGLDWNGPELLVQLNQQAPPGLKFLDIQLVGNKDRARVESLVYRTLVPQSLLAKTSLLIPKIVAKEALWVHRQDPAAPPMVFVDPNSRFAKNLKSSLQNLTLGDGFQLEITLVPQPEGTLKPIEILAMLDWPLSSKDFPAPQWERTRLNIADDDSLERLRTS